MRINVRPTRGCQHGKSFAERTHPLDRGFHVWWKAIFLFFVSQRLDAGVTDVVQFVRDGVLKFRCRFFRIEVEENRRISSGFKNETVGYGFDNGEYFSVDMAWSGR